MAETTLANVVGDSNVVEDRTILSQFTENSEFPEAAEPRSIVKPANANEVQKIVEWANETSTPLVPVSSGPPHGRGDTAPGRPGAVVVDLSRMNRIVRIDTQNRVAMVEPGVTFGNLQSALAERGLCAYLPLGPRSTKSVIGSMLEREPIMRPSLHWDSTDPLLCTEVVFGSGDRFRTGEASGPETIEEQWEMDRVQMNPFGHSHVDFQRLLSGAQGTIGIVTWATLKCSPLPVTRKILLVPSSQVEPLIDFVYRLVRFRFGGHLFILNNVNLACLVGKESTAITKLAANLSPWVLVITFEGYGTLPEEKIAWEEADFRSMVETNGLRPQAVISEQDALNLLSALAYPSEPHWKRRLAGDFRELFFLTTLDKCPAFAASVSSLAKLQDFPTDRLGVYIQPIVQGTSCHCEFNFYFDPADTEKAGGSKHLASTACTEVARKGAFLSRPYPLWRETAYREAPTTVAMQKKIKAIFDPKGILNPGKLCF